AETVWISANVRKPCLSASGGTPSMLGGDGSWKRACSVSWYASADSRRSPGAPGSVPGAARLESGGVVGAMGGAEGLGSLGVFPGGMLPEGGGELGVVEPGAGVVGAPGFVDGVCGFGDALVGAVV